MVKLSTSDNRTLCVCVMMIEKENWKNSPIKACHGLLLNPNVHCNSTDNHWPYLCCPANRLHKSIQSLALRFSLKQNPKGKNYHIEVLLPSALFCINPIILCCGSHLRVYSLHTLSLLQGATPVSNLLPGVRMLVKAVKSFILINKLYLSPLDLAVLYCKFEGISLLNYLISFLNWISKAKTNKKNHFFALHRWFVFAFSMSCERPTTASGWQYPFEPWWPCQGWY